MPANQVRRMVGDVKGQAPALDEFVRAKLPRAPRGAIFVGSGDSYAAALAGFYVSGGDCLALDPYSLASAPGVAAGKEVFFISVSGRTSSNIAAARKVRGLAAKTTALTADDRSELAAATERVVKLPMKAMPRAPGLLSFSLSLAAVLKISEGSFACDFRRALREAVVDSREVSFARGTTFFLGNSAAYAVSLYSAAKVYELIGARAHAELLGEFSHLSLFSLRKSDSVNIFSSYDASGVGGRLRQALAERGYESRLIRSRGRSEAETLFHSVFAAQMAVLRNAEEAGLSRPAFLTARDRLMVSDAMIYSWGSSRRGARKRLQTPP
jgi:glutamine---fructose-6-phosphate transaminase (isomerizing)